MIDKKIFNSFVLIVIAKLRVGVGQKGFQKYPLELDHFEKQEFEAEWRNRQPPQT